MNKYYFRMLKTWDNFVVIGVINCADELNSPVCREHAIDSFPTLKVIIITDKNSFKYCDTFSTSMSVEEIVTMVKNLMAIITTLFLYLTGSLKWPKKIMT